MTAVLDAIAGGRGLVVVGFKIEFPGFDFLISKAGYSSLAGGHFEARVVSFGSAEFMKSGDDGGLAGVQMRIRVRDDDRRLRKLYEGARKNEIRGSVATGYLMTPTVSYSTDVRFGGVVTKLSFPPRTMEAEITLRTNDDALLRPVGLPLSRVDWPFADPAIFDKVAPVLYGLHDASYTRNGPAMVPTLCVDTMQHRYLVCRGRALSIIRAFDGTTPVSISTEYLTRSGRIYTVAKLSSAPTGEVTVDVQGMETVGDGSGTLITNPATQLAHRLTNFVLGDYMTGAWASTHALLDSTHLTSAETYFTALGARGSMYDDSERSGADILAAHCRSFGMRCWWTPAGKIASGYENVFAQPYTGERFRWYRDDASGFGLEEDDYNVVRQVTVRQAHSAADDGYLATLELQDASITTGTQEALDLEHSEAR